MIMIMLNIMSVSIHFRKIQFKMNIFLTENTRPDSLFSRESILSLRVPTSLISFYDEYKGGVSRRTGNKPQTINHKHF